MTTATDCCRSLLFHSVLSLRHYYWKLLFSTFNHLTDPILSGGTRSVYIKQKFLCTKFTHALSVSPTCISLLQTVQYIWWRVPRGEVLWW